MYHDYKLIRYGLFHINEYCVRNGEILLSDEINRMFRDVIFAYIINYIYLNVIYIYCTFVALKYIRSINVFRFKKNKRLIDNDDAVICKWSVKVVARTLRYRKYFERGRFQVSRRIHLLCNGYRPRIRSVAVGAFSVTRLELWIIKRPNYLIRGRDRYSRCLRYAEFNTGIFNSRAIEKLEENTNSSTRETTKANDECRR